MASKPLDAAVYAYLVDNDFLDAAKALRTQLGVKGGELLFAALFGWVFWREWPGAHVWWGALFVVGAGLYTLWRERARTLVSG